MGKLTGLVSIVSELRTERTVLATQLKHIDAALSVLGKLNGGKFYTQPRRTLSVAARKVQPKRAMSAAARKKVAAFQRARWAKVKAQQKKAA